MISEEESCQCSHCRLGISVEFRKKIFSKFLLEVFVLFIKNNHGFKSETLDSEVECVARIFSDAIFKEETEESKEQMEFAYNKAFSFFDSPFNFYIAFTHFEKESEAALKAVEEDNEIKAAPILTGIITPEIFQEYIHSGDLPDSVSRIINAEITISDIDTRVSN